MATSARGVVDDGTALTVQAWRLLSDVRIQPIADFLTAAERNPTSVAERQTILDQASLMFTHLYPHMPFKTDIYHFPHPTDVIEQNIRPQAASLCETDFHGLLIAAFSLVRDAHTLYGLPSPYRGAVAFLPFQMRPYTDQTGRHYIVTKVMNSQPQGGFGHPFFGPGAEIVGWGDQDIESHLLRAAGSLSGGNCAATFLRAAAATTVRPMTFLQIPFDDERPAATVRYRPLGSPAGSDTLAIQLPWGVVNGLPMGQGFPSRSFSVSPVTAAITSCANWLQYGTGMGWQSAPTASQDRNQVSALPDVFEFQYTNGPPQAVPIDLTDPNHPDARFGYIRIKNFGGDGVELDGGGAIVAEFQRILALMDGQAPDGLVLDIRDNPGGDVRAAERMLQMLTPASISPARFHLANTPAVLQILRNLKAPARGLSPQADVKLTDAKAELAPWLNDVANPPLPDGERLTSGQTLTDVADANDTGQIYQGPVVLVTDGLTYSAADIFAGGFLDHAIGTIMSADDTTGGGGGNLWNHTDLLDKLGPAPGIDLAQLPRDCTMSLAIRRSSRVQNFDGQPLEDVGAQTGILYTPESVEDVLAGYPGLIRRACQRMGASRTYRVDAAMPTVLRDGSVTVALTTRNIDSLKFFLNGHLALSVAANAGTGGSFTVPAAAGSSAPSRLTIQGFALSPAAAGESAERLSAVRRIPLRAAAPQQPSDAPDPATDSITGLPSDGV